MADLVSLVPLLFILGTLVLLVGVGVTIAWHNRWRWGSVLDGAATRLDAGPFRQAQLQGRKARTMPMLIVGTGVFSFLWAPITAFFFAPLGLLGALFLAAVPEVLRGALPLGGLMAAANGWILAMGLLIAGTSLVQVRKQAPELAKGIGLWSLVHHAVVMALYGLAATTGGEHQSIFTVLCLGPCLVGMAHGLAMIVAGFRMAAIRGEMIAEERAALA
jgi:hypothetical protein